jgi:hypothetical protein
MQETNGHVGWIIIKGLFSVDCYSVKLTQRSWNIGKKKNRKIGLKSLDIDERWEL